MTAWLLSTGLVASGVTIHVTTAPGTTLTPDSPGPSAKRSVTAALAAAQAGDQVRVAFGTYPERIRLKKGVALYGGYAGVGDQRDYRNNLTILDGGAAGAVVLCQDATVDLDTRLDGFVIQNGKSIAQGGIGIVGGAPTIANNIIRKNASNGEGAGICCYNGAHPLILNNLIYQNSALGPLGDGGGICCMAGDSPGTTGSSPRIVGNTLSHNIADQNGGGICSKGGSAPVIIGNNITMTLRVAPPVSQRRPHSPGRADSPHPILPVTVSHRRSNGRPAHGETRRSPSAFGSSNPTLFHRVPDCAAAAICTTASASRCGLGSALAHFR